MMPPELRQLMERFNTLGRMLPRDTELPDDPAGLAEVMIIVAEMNKIDAEFNAFLNRHRG
jgi:hypothetical protein